MVIGSAGNQTETRAQQNLGQGLGVFIYLRNLMLIARSRKAERAGEGA